MPTTAGGSPSSSSSTTTTTTSSASAATSAAIRNPNPSGDLMQISLESIPKAQSRIHALAVLLAAPTLVSLADSDRPARSLLYSSEAYAAVSAAVSAPLSGSGDDPLCQWLYETFQASDPDLRLVVLSFLPLLSSIYLSRVVATFAADAHQPSLAGFEAVLVALYSTEAKARAGKPILVSVPDLSQPSLYHSPHPTTAAARSRGSTASTPSRPVARPSVGFLSPPLEPQIAVKSTKRACIVGVALECYYKKIALMPSRSKIDFCEFVASWAGQDCSCCFELDDQPTPTSSSSSPEIRNFSEDDAGVGTMAEQMGKLGIRERPNGYQCNGEEKETGRTSRASRVPLPWELLQPVLRILGHCLLGPLNPQEVKDVASMAVRCVYARASHELVPQAILATRSLIQLDKNARKAAKAATMAGTPGASSNTNTPRKPKKPEILLVSK
ncbi:Hyccin [Cocos nucifera]|uniref:Hyccin n=1 Tax=Cocos nucifera TaxID=13894 RepID=A0A8K0MWR3_COCNU|nr:Hyccin [Cocos nucifera]